MEADFQPIPFDSFGIRHKRGSRCDDRLNLLQVMRWVGGRAAYGSALQDLANFKQIHDLTEAELGHGGAAIGRMPHETFAIEPAKCFSNGRCGN